MEMITNLMLYFRWRWLQM